MFNKLIISFIISSFCFNVFAKNPNEAVINYNSIPTVINYYPFSDFSFENEKITWHSSSNLRKKTGSSFTAIGELLILEGYIFDINNIPIDNVEVRIIQTNSNGIYSFESNQNNALYDINFAGNGVAVTDNRGYYRFVTVFPGYYNKRAPHIHFLLNYNNYVVLESEIFFKNHPRNKTDYKYKSLTKQQKNNLTADVFLINRENKNDGKIAKFNVILNLNQNTKQL